MRLSALIYKALILIPIPLSSGCSFHVHLHVGKSEPQTLIEVDQNGNESSNVDVERPEWLEIVPWHGGLGAPWNSETSGVDNS